MSRNVAEDLGTLELLRNELERTAHLDPPSAVRDAVAYLINRAIDEDERALRAHSLMAAPDDD